MNAQKERLRKLRKKYRKPRKVLKRKTKFSKKVGRAAVKIAKNLPMVIARDTSEIAGKPLPKKMKHRKASGYESVFGKGMFK
jgi:hypothetical protein